ncbi:hypothetical protein ABIA33_002795 [Streptacidiphilus sp. MAP12-16]|uniref:hypothetical protein n=1 Tax=Streptacidiphilus sp. MAP12-16 TaxID=3156300 RepID=UPI0035188D39
MPPIGSLEQLLRAVGGHVARGLLAVDPHGGQSRARRNAAQAAAQASAQRYEREEVSAWTAERAAARTDQVPGG